MATHTRRTADPFTPALSRVLNNGWVAAGDELLPVLKRYVADRNAADFNYIIERLAPLLLSEARKAKRRNPDFYTAEIDELVSDGYLGLVRSVNALRDIRGVGSVAFLARRTVRESMRRQAAARRAERFGERGGDRVVTRFRSQLITELGRTPTAEELTAAVASLFTNPQLHVGHRPHVTSIDADHGESGKPLRSTIAGPDSDPSTRAIDAETLGIVLKGMDHRDRKIFNRVMRGDAYADVGRELGVSRQRVHQRINGILWTLRNRADLMEYLDVEPVDATAADIARQKRPAANPMHVRRAG